MASILKVDEMQGVTSAGDITITGEGTATMQLQQGLCVKMWCKMVLLPAQVWTATISSQQIRHLGHYNTLIIFLMLWQAHNIQCAGFWGNDGNGVFLWQIAYRLALTQRARYKTLMKWR